MSKFDQALRKTGWRGYPDAYPPQEPPAPPPAQAKAAAEPAPAVRPSAPPPPPPAPASVEVASLLGVTAAPAQPRPFYQGEDLGGRLGLGPTPYQAYGPERGFQPAPPPQPIQPLEGFFHRSSVQYQGQPPAMWMLAPTKHRGVMETFRVFKNNLVLINRESGFRTFMLTGPDKAVGVSTMAANLALVLAWDLVDSRILIIDANTVDPGLHLGFGLPQGPGLMDYLLENYALAQSIQATDRPNLHVMPIGATDRRVYSPFDLERFTSLLKEAKDHYNYVIIDTAPALRSSDSRIIASKVDGVILVAKANTTRWEVFVELNRQLQKDGAKTVGSVLNQRQFVIPQALYKYL